MLDDRLAGRSVITQVWRETVILHDVYMLTYLTK